MKHGGWLTRKLLTSYLLVFHTVQLLNSHAQTAVVLFDQCHARFMPIDFLPNLLTVTDNDSFIADGRVDRDRGLRL